jgi:predicted amidohydrolase YtcJ
MSAWGYDVIAMGGAQLDKTELDKISATQPILVWDASEHFVYANSAALKKYKVTRDDTKFTGIMAGPDGEPNGQFLGEKAAQRILQETIAELLQRSVALANVRFLMDLSRQNGITTTSEMAYGIIDLPLEEALFDRYFNDPMNPMRCVVVTDAVSLMAGKGDQAVAYAKGLSSRDTDKLIFNGVKFFADDAFLSLGMVIEKSRVHRWAPGPVHDRARSDGRDDAAMVGGGLPDQRPHQRNGGNQATINARLMALKPRTDHRFALHHYGISTPEMARRVARPGGIASVNPYYLYARSEFNAPFTGTDRAYSAALLRTLVDSGVPTSLHSDTPVAPPRPLEEVWIAVNRFGLSGKVRGPQERISVDQALRMVTIEAAFAHGMEDKVGSIAPGKYADFAVLEQDPYEVAKEKIRDIRIWGTVLGGKCFRRAK